jgi:hypothetical protein
MLLFTVPPHLSVKQLGSEKRRRVVAINVNAQASASESCLGNVHAPASVLLQGTWRAGPTSYAQPHCKSVATSACSVVALAHLLVELACEGGLDLALQALRGLCRPGRLALELCDVQHKVPLLAVDAVVLAAHTESSSSSISRC